MTTKTCGRCQTEILGAPVIAQPLGAEICRTCARAHNICGVCGYAATADDPVVVSVWGETSHRSHVPGLVAEAEQRLQRTIAEGRAAGLIGSDAEQAEARRWLAEQDGEPCESCGARPATPCRVEPADPRHPDVMTLCASCALDVDAEAAPVFCGACGNPGTDADPLVQAGQSLVHRSHLLVLRSGLQDQDAAATIAAPGSAGTADGLAERAGMPAVTAAPTVVETPHGPRAVFTALFVPSGPGTAPAHLAVYGMTCDENPDTDGGDYAVGLLAHHQDRDVLTDIEDDLSYREAVGIMFRRAERLL